MNNSEDPIITKLKQSKSFLKSGGRERQKDPNYYKEIISHVSFDGLWIDLCIGKTVAVTQHIIRNSPDNITLYGFDWFKGLPEEWNLSDTESSAVGEFAVTNESIDDFIAAKEKQYPKLKIINGLIQDTLPVFLEEHPDNCAFINVDCDLYSSANCALMALQDRIVPGTVINFDEFWGYDNYRNGEYKAFMEFIERTGYKYRFIAHVERRYQAAIKIL